MWEDPIVKEMREIKEALAAEFNYDIQAIVEDIKRQQRESGRTYVSYPPKRIKPEERPVPKRKAG